MLRETTVEQRCAPVSEDWTAAGSVQCQLLSTNGQHEHRPAFERLTHVDERLSGSRSLAGVGENKIERSVKGGVKADVAVESVGKVGSGLTFDC